MEITVGHKAILETISQEVLNKYLSVDVEATEATPIIGSTFRTVILEGKKKRFLFFPFTVGCLNS